MKTLYESILDDEDVLISKTKKDGKCPLFSLYYLYKQYNSFEKISDEDIKEVIVAIGLPNIKNLVIKKYKHNISLYDQSLSNITQSAVCNIEVDSLTFDFTNREYNDYVIFDLHDKKSVNNKYFGSKKKYDEFCKKMWGWGFVQPNYSRFYYKFK